MDDYHLVSKCSEKNLSDTRVTTVSLSVSAQWLRKNNKQTTGPNRTGKCLNKIEFYDIILSFFTLFLLINNNKNTSINSELKSN